MSSLEIGTKFRFKSLPCMVLEILWHILNYFVTSLGDLTLITIEKLIAIIFFFFQSVFMRSILGTGYRGNHVEIVQIKKMKKKNVRHVTSKPNSG